MTFKTNISLKHSSQNRMVFITSKFIHFISKTLQTAKQKPPTYFYFNSNRLCKEYLLSCSFWIHLWAIVDLSAHSDLQYIFLKRQFIDFDWISISRLKCWYDLVPLNSPSFNLEIVCNVFNNLNDTSLVFSISVHTFLLVYAQQRLM